jgi:iron complex outermembrane receptor protein
MILLSLCLISSSSIAAEIISGKVYDAKSKQPLVGATVKLKTENRGAITDKNGQFTIEDVSVPADMEVKYIGYDIQTINLKSGDSELSVPMEQKISSTQTILVEGTTGEVAKLTTASTIVGKEDIQTRLDNQDVPEFLSYQPSVFFHSESGSSVGYSYMSIRGFDQRRLSISINGVPQNDPEDHNVYWPDMPNVLANAELVQVQRGAGNGLVNYPAIGGAVNIVTSRFSDKPVNKYSFVSGANNYKKYGVEYSSGLVNNKYAFYTNLTAMSTDGYRDLSDADHKSFFVSAVRYDKKLTTQLNFFGGWIHGGLNYTGISKEAIKDRDLRKKNYSWWAWNNDKNNFEDYSTKRREDEKEYFFQPHFEILNEYEVSENLIFNSNLFMVLGEGYFDYDGSWAWNGYYRLPDTATAVKNSLIRAYVDNHQIGWNGRMAWTHTNGKLYAGAQIRRHRSDHWGAIQYAEALPAGINSDYKYYRYNGGVDIYSAFIHENYNITDNFSAIAEVHTVYNKYQIFDEDYVDNEFDINHFFLNPKVGVNYKFTDNFNAFLSYANVSKEPRLKAYYDAAESSGGAKPNFEQDDNGNFDFDKPLINPEVMNDIEFGVNFSAGDFAINTNLYYMLFTDEIVKKGQLDRFGQPITGNMDETVHYGVEVNANYRINNMFNFIFNTTYSKNYISKGVAYIKKVDTPIDVTDNEIAGFPNLMMNGILQFNYSGLTVLGELKYVGDYYSNNFGENFADLVKANPKSFDYTDNKVEAYFIANAMVSYEMKNTLSLPSMRVFVRVNNIMDELYTAYAVGNDFFPAPERNINFGIELGL